MFFQFTAISGLPTFRETFDFGTFLSFTALAVFGLRS